jgi:hypothetical protein
MDITGSPYRSHGTARGKDAFDEIGTSQRRNTEVRLTHRWRGVDSNFGFREALLSPTARPWSRRLVRAGAGFRVDTLVQIDATHFGAGARRQRGDRVFHRRFSSLSPRIQ